MLRTILKTIVFFTLTACAHKHTHWSYSGDAGPEKWGGLDYSYRFCQLGRQQSPINIPVSTQPPSSRMKTLYQHARVSLKNNGHTIQADLKDSYSIHIGAERYKLIQLHFHLPSEHAIKDSRAPMEVHLVHSNDDGKLAVLGVLIESGAYNETIAPLWDRLPLLAGSPPVDVPVRFNLNAFLPESAAYFEYTGSLTTPPCTEGVKWYVFEKSIQFSPEQIKKFADNIGVNSRPVQPLFNRPVYYNN